MPVETLTKAGRYDLREELGHGAMGVVYHGFDPVIGRDVAVKTLRLSETGTGLSRQELVSRFQTEARAAGVLTHPNIVVVYDAGEEDGLFYITMEYVLGRSLQAMIDAKQPFPVSRVMRFMEQVCSALDFAHQHNVVHRDIKPANLMLTSDDVVKITDFGTAKILQFGTAQTAHVMGTPSYMSPEQVKGKPVDGRSDIFSLGVILYEMLTGEKPFPGQNITTVIYKIINEEPIPPRSLDSSIHPGLSAVITRALAKEPAARYQNCNELLTALKNFHEQTAPTATARALPTGQALTGTSRINSSTPRNNAAVPVVPARPIIPVEPPSVMLSYSGAAEEPQKRPGGLLLTLILLGIIGYAGYRVYAPAMDLWRRAHAAVESPAPASKPAPAPQSVAPENAASKPETAAAEAPQSPATAETPGVTATVAETVVAPPDTPQQPKPSPAVVAIKSEETSVANSAAVEKPVATPKPALITAPSPARRLETKLRADISAKPLADKLTIKSTENAVTLSGSLTLAEHRELMNDLRAVPAGVRVIDDTEFADNFSPASATSSAGWIWMRSLPPGARILVDGVETGLRTPARVELQAGEHEVRLVRPGFSTAQRSISVAAGQTSQFTEPLKIQ